MPQRKARLALLLATGISGTAQAETLYLYRNVDRPSVAPTAQGGKPATPVQGGGQAQPESKPLEAALASPPASASVGDASTMRFIATNASGTVNWVATGLPTGTRIEADGTVSGTFAAAGTFAVAATATDAAGRSATASGPVTILPARPMVGVVQASGASIYGTTFSTRALNLGSTPGISWTLAQGPSWLGIDAAGLVSGRPPLGTMDFAFTVRGTDGYGRQAEDSAAVSLTPPSLSFSFPGQVVPGDVVSVALSSNLASPTYGVVTGPPWLSVAPGAKLVGTVPNLPGSGTVTAQAAQEEAKASVEATFEVLSVTPSLSLPATLQGLETSTGTVRANAGDGWTYAVSGLPSWLGLNASNGTLSGTAPNADATLTLTPSVSRNGVTVTGTSRTYQVNAYKMAVTNAPTSVMAGDAMTGTAAGADPGTYALTGAPAWMTVSRDGTLGGTADNVAATYSVKVAGTRYATALQPATVPLTVRAATVTLPTMPSSVTSGTTASYQPSTNWTSGVTWSLSSQPAWMTINAQTGAFSGTPVTGQNAVNTVVKATRNGVTASSAPFSFTVAAAGPPVGDFRPQTMFYANAASFYNPMPSAAVALDGLNDGNEGTNVVGLRTDATFDALLYRFAAPTSLNHCRIVVQTSTSTSASVKLAVSAGYTWYPEFTIPVTGNVGIYDGTCNLPSNTKDTEFYLSQLSKNPGAGATVMIREFRMGYR